MTMKLFVLGLMILDQQDLISSSVKDR